MSRLNNDETDYRTLFNVSNSRASQAMYLDKKDIESINDSFKIMGEIRLCR